MKRYVRSLSINEGGSASSDSAAIVLAEPYIKGTIGKSGGVAGNSCGVVGKSG